MARFLENHFTVKSLLKFTLPTMAMMVFTSLYTVVDGLFVSNFIGKTALAAVNLIWPVIMIFAAVGLMIGTGGSALVAKTRGEGDDERANRYFTMCVIFAVILSTVLGVVGQHHHGTTDHSAWRKRRLARTNAHLWPVDHGRATLLRAPIRFPDPLLDRRQAFARIRGNRYRRADKCRARLALHLRTRLVGSRSSSRHRTRSDSRWRDTAYLFRTEERKSSALRAHEARMATFRKGVPERLIGVGLEHRHQPGRHPLQLPAAVLYRRERGGRLQRDG